MARLIAALSLTAAALMPDLLLAQGNDNGRGQSGKPPGQYVVELIQDLPSGRARGEATSGAARDRNSGEPPHCPVEGSFINPDSCQCPPPYTLAAKHRERAGVQLLYYCVQE